MTISMVKNLREKFVKLFLFKDLVNHFDKPTINGDSETKKIQSTIVKHSHTSPILHRLLTSPTKLNEPSVSSNQPDLLDTMNNKSPQYRPRFSPFYIPDSKTNGKLLTKDSLTK